MKDLRIAAVVCRAPAGKIDRNIDRTIHWTEKAKQSGASLVCFPELNITGYFNHEDIAAIALSTDDPAIRRLSDEAKHSNMIILAGMAERNPAGHPFASHCVFWPTGEISVYRKLHLAPNEKPFFTAGDTIPTFHAPQADFGIQLCYDGHFPELSTAMTARKVQIIFMPHASPRGEPDAKHQSWMRHLPARAYDNGIFIVAVNQLGTNGKGLTFPGNAVILDPSGKIVDKRLADSEGLLVADLQAGAWHAVRSHPMRHFFPNRRPELYR